MKNIKTISKKKKKIRAKKSNTIAITVIGGVVQRLVSSEPQTAILIDYDDIKEGGDIITFPVEVGFNKVKREVQQAQKAVLRHRLNI